METIRIYLDNIFRALPQTEQVLRMKADLLNDMEAKYTALRADGKSDSQAVAQVIGEFGNIDELLGEMGIERPDPAALPQVSPDAAQDFILRSSRAARQVGAAVAVIIVSVAVMIGWYGRIARLSTLNAPVEGMVGLAPVIFLLIMVALSVAVIIRSGFHLSEYAHIDQGGFTLRSDALPVLQRGYGEARQKSLTGVVTGVVLCILAPALLMIVIALNEANALYGVCLMLLLVAAAVYLFVSIGSSTEPYKKLMMLEEYRPENRVALRRKGAVIGMLWMVAVAIFLAWGFLYDGWRIAWVVYPIAGVLTGAVSSFMDRS